VAVSGGADSTALLVGLHSIAHEFDLTLHAAHLHHGLRGRAADADARAVRRLCAELAVPLTSARVDARRVMAEHGWSGEDGLRRIRRRFLATAARRAGAHAIATAHTADDQLETLLFRLARGAGLRGLGGMRPRAGRWWKPLLEATRAEIEQDLGRAGLAWREDESNRSPAYARNRIRHGVVPALAAAAGTSRSGLAKRAANAAAEARAAEKSLGLRVRSGLRKISRIEGGVLRLDPRGLAPYPSTARRIAFQLLWSRLERRAGLTHRHLDALLKLVETGGRRAEVRLPGGWKARRVGREIHWLATRKREESRATSTEGGARLEAHGGPSGS